MALKLTTINVCRGMFAIHKKCEINTRCKNLDFNIIFLQELKITQASEVKKCEREWNGKLFCSYSDDPNSNRGVGIFIRNNVNYKLCACKTDWEGRVVCLDINIGEHPFRFLSVYAPNNQSLRKDFITQLEMYLMTSRTIICGGDWNFIEDPNIDKWVGI